MGAVWMLARSELRRRWRSVVVLTLLVGFVGAVVLALVGGARRTDTSLAALRGAEPRAPPWRSTPATQRRRRSRCCGGCRGSTAVAELYQLTLVSGSTASSRWPDRWTTVSAATSTAPGWSTDALADQTRSDELTIGESLASELHLEVGDRLTFHSYSPADIEAARANNAATPKPHGPDVSLRVVGIVRRPLDLGGRGTAGGVVVPTAAFVEQYRDQIGSFGGSILRVRTEHGDADLPRVPRAAKRIFGGSDEFSLAEPEHRGPGRAERDRRHDRRAVPRRGGRGTHRARRDRHRVVA